MFWHWQWLVSFPRASRKFPVAGLWLSSQHFGSFIWCNFKRPEIVRTENFEILNPSRYVAPAALAEVCAFTNGAVGSRIPDNNIWRRALCDDPVTNLLLDIVTNPVLAESTDHISPLDHIYRQPARQQHFSVKNGILFMKEIFKMTFSMSTCGSCQLRWSTLYLSHFMRILLVVTSIFIARIIASANVTSSRECGNISNACAKPTLDAVCLIWQKTDAWT